MQGKNSAKHGMDKSIKIKPKDFYSSSTRGYVYGDNTTRSKGRVTKVLFIILPFVMIAVIAVGFMLGYISYTNGKNGNGADITVNENYISPEQQKTLYRSGF